MKTEMMLAIFAIIISMFAVLLGVLAGLKSKTDPNQGLPHYKKRRGTTGIMNPVVQFDYDNREQGNEKVTLRIGSVTGIRSAYLNYGLTPCAVDNMIIKDQFGPGCFFTEGFSKGTISNAMMITEVHVISSSDKQHNQILMHKTISPDQIITTRTNNTNTHRESDTLTVHKGEWPLSATEWLECIILPDTCVTILLMISEIEDIRFFSKVSEK